MSPSTTPPSPRLRVDAARNRERLIEAATRTFASAETEPSVRVIAQEAGVGIGTLYRHFPTRESLVAAVYHGQLERLTSGARELLAELPPTEAMRRWLDLFAVWVATKRGMLDTMVAMIDSGELGLAESRAQVLATITALLDAGRATGDLRGDISAEDVAANLLGILTIAGGADHQAQAQRLLDLLMDGLRPPAVSPTAAAG